MINRREFVLGPLFVPRFVRAVDTGKPKQILVIRHAEKTGAKTDAHLNARGYERAAAFAPPVSYQIRDSPIHFCHACLGA